MVIYLTKLRQLANTKHRSNIILQNFEKQTTVHESGFYSTVNIHTGKYISVTFLSMVKDSKFNKGTFYDFIFKCDFSDVRANCLCTSLLHTRFISQRHATSCTSARAKEEVYSHEGMVAVALTLLKFNSLGWSVTPTFFFCFFFFV